MKEIVKLILSSSVYFFYKYKIIKSKFTVLTIDETIDMLVNSDNSLVRYGDGEIALMRGFSIKFQEYNQELANELIEISKSEIPIALPDVFQSLEQYEHKTKVYWMKDIFINRKIYYKFFLNNKIYYNSFVSRLYMPFLNFNMTEKWYDKIQKLWLNKDVLIVEGVQTRLGVGNDLFEKCNSIERILCPNTNAYTKVNIIFDLIVKNSKNKLVLIALGPTAKVLVARLNKVGIRAIDIGHIDIEYEWFKQKTYEKTEIKTKYTNETNQTFIEDVNDLNYTNQIICNVQDDGGLYEKN